MKHSKYLVFLLIVLCYSCTRGKKAEEFTIQGQFSNSHGEKVVFGEMDIMDRE